MPTFWCAPRAWRPWGIGVPGQLLAPVAVVLTDPAWQVRAGAAVSLGGAAPDHGVPALAELLKDTDADVRKAAVLGPARCAAHDDARTALASAVDDLAADVRAYAGLVAR